MLSFFKKRDEKPQLHGSESTVSSDDFGYEQEKAGRDDEQVQTELSFPPVWNISKEDMYSFQFLNGECAPLKPNQISLSGIELRQDESKNVSVTAFVRSSLDKPIKFEETTLVLLDQDGKVFGRKSFDLGAIGELPPRSSRPWVFEFNEKDLLRVDVPKTGWKLAFQLESKHRLDLEPTWEKALDDKAKQQLTDLVEKVGAPSKGEVNFLGVQAQQKEDGSLHVTLLIRNGSEKNINLEQLPLHVEDASGKVIAKGGFKLDEFAVKANTSKPWTFIFPKEMVLEENPDLSKWKAYAPQK